VLVANLARKYGRISWDTGPAALSIGTRDVFWRTRFCDETALPISVAGLRERAPLRRPDSARAGLASVRLISLVMTTVWTIVFSKIVWNFVND
jgi:hypothetical protein